MAKPCLQTVCSFLLVVQAAAAQPPLMIPGIEVGLRPASYQVPLGQPVWVEFAVSNTSEEPVTLTVPGTEPSIPSPESGLPVRHVFSGTDSSGVMLTTPSGRTWEQPVGKRLSPHAPILMIAPRSSVGVSLDLREFFPALRGAGQYRITWAPYGGVAGAASVVLTISTLKRVVIVTEEGSMTIQFFYSSAPMTVANFLELVRTGFYTGKTFHRVEPGYFIQGGCPRGDGTGIRLDGKRIPAEFNHHLVEKGAVAMALLDDDPDSASCQFFICNTRQKEWDGRYTVFGRLVGDESFATLERLIAQPVDDAGRPKDTIYMRTVRIIDAPPDETP